jgi:hypothetical protein
MGLFGTEITDKIISLIPKMGQNINMKDGENEDFSEDDSLLCCIVKNGILVELSATMVGETIGQCNHKINILKKYLLKHGFEYIGKFQYDIHISENYTNEKYEVTICNPKQEFYGGFTVFLRLC